jgi:protein TonB
MVSGSANSGQKNDLTTSLSIPIAGDFRPVPATTTRREARVLLIALFAAVLLHASAILSVLIEWPDFGRPIEPRDIPVELVFESPPKIEELRDSPPPPERESGGDPNLAQGRPADVAPEPAAPPEPSPAKPAEVVSPLPEPTPTERTADFAPPLKKPEPPSPPTPPTQTAAPPAPPQQAPPAQIAKTTPSQPSRLSMIGQGGGDSYLNQIRDMIEKQRSYPDIANPMRLSGIAIFEIRLSRDGQIASLILLRSTGVGPLDQEGGRIVRRAGPFPPVPPDIRSNLPGNLLGMRLDLPIHP